MTPDKCPSCGTKLHRDLLACPNCPMSFPEDDGPKKVTNPLQQSRYYKFLFPAILFGAIGASIWYLGMGLMHLGTSNTAILNEAVPEKPAPAAPPAGPGGEGSSGVSPSAAAAAASGATKTSAGEAKPAEEEPMVVVTRAPADAPAPRAERSSAPRKAATEWRLRGTVYDLTTLKPLSGCAVLFTDQETNRSIKTRTDSSGRYRAVVPPLRGGYSVAIEKSGYAQNYLDPRTGGVRQLGAGVRTGMARGLAATLSAAPAILRDEDGEPLVTDFYLAPRQ
ncbi:MAG: carboxypeptidase-like regulatory domain-containing protein [Elusimicrobiota bacterium]